MKVTVGERLQECWFNVTQHMLDLWGMIRFLLRTTRFPALIFVTSVEQTSDAHVIRVLWSWLAAEDVP
jgi:hypothetical protein